MVKQIAKFIKRKNRDFVFTKPTEQPIVEETKVEEKKDNKKKKNKKDMTFDELERAESLVQDMAKPKVKVIKKEKGLIERTESDKIVLAEDNRQVLVD